LSQCNYFGPRNFGVFASYYTETLLYSNFGGPLFLQTCQAREIHEIKGTQKNGFYSILNYSTITNTNNHFNDQFPGLPGSVALDAPHAHQTNKCL